MKNIFALLLLMIAQCSLAQDKYFYISLDVNKPLSNSSWVTDWSARGARAGYRAFITPKFSAGLDLGWSAFDQYKPTETVSSGSGAITTDYFNYVYSYSIAASGQYYFTMGDGETFFPYAGLGLGANNNEYVKYYNIYTDSERSWGFLARPEAGILVKFGGRRNLGAMAAIHYDYSTNQTDQFGYKNFNTLGFQIGLIFLDF
jgi:hypothetical protein